MKKNKLSERSLSEKSGLSRQTVRNILEQHPSVSFENYKKVAKTLNKDVNLVFSNSHDIFDSTKSILYLSSQNHTNESFSLKLDELLDYIRLTKDDRVLALPPVSSHLKSKQLWELLYRLHSTCFAIGIKIPYWLSHKFKTSLHTDIDVSVDCSIKLGEFSKKVGKISCVKIIDESFWDRRNLLALNYLQAEYHFPRINVFNPLEFDTAFYNIKLSEI